MNFDGELSGSINVYFQVRHFDAKFSDTALKLFRHTECFIKSNRIIAKFSVFPNRAIFNIDWRQGTFISKKFIL